jgi:periplasmic protein TonB
LTVAALPTFGAFLGAQRPRRGRARRRLAVLLSVLAHFGAVLVLVRLRPAPEEAEAPPVREPIFLRLAPPPPARPPTAAPAQPPRPVRRPPPRPALVQPPVEPLPPPEDPEPVIEESEPPPEEELAEVASAVAPAAPALLTSATGRVGGLPGGDGDAVLELAQVARPPVVLAQVKPEYPAEARWKRIEGLVLVRLVIGTDGRVEAGSVRVVRSVAALDGAAIAAMERWRFSPAIGHGGHPVRVAIEVPFQFSLR